MFKLLRKLRKDNSGATAIEYGLIAALVGIVIATGLTTLGGTLDTLFGTTVNNELNAASGTGTTG